MLRLAVSTLVPLLLSAGAWFAAAQDPAGPPTGQFGLSRLATASGTTADIDAFYSNRSCAICHKTQFKAMKGSMHSAAHVDPLYRAFAEMARREAGEEVYTFCSGCHSPAGVISETIPGTPEDELPPAAKEGVTCEACHQITALTGTEGPWSEPGNGSVVLAAGENEKYGPGEQVLSTPAHDGEARDFYTKSEYCASCHTIIHPINGLRIEHTYDEWKNSIYAEKGIQCQDCHMRTIEDAIEVARTLTPQKKAVAPWARKAEPRPISVHSFVGGNVHADLLAKGSKHAADAERRLQSAATLDVELPATAAAGSTIDLDVVVTNVGAGHSLPTSLTELREMWVHLRVLTADGKVLHESGNLDVEENIREGAMRFGAHTVDANGVVTYKPWEAVGFGWKRLIPAKESARDTFQVDVPAGAKGPLTVEARLLYRIAPPSVVKMVMGDEAFEPKIVEMTTARAELALR